jgi:hypothetical protein
MQIAPPQAHERGPVPQCHARQGARRRGAAIDLIASIPAQILPCPIASIEGLPCTGNSVGRMPAEPRAGSSTAHHPTPPGDGRPSNVTVLCLYGAIEEMPRAVRTRGMPGRQLAGYPDEGKTVSSYLAGTAASMGSHPRCNSARLQGAGALMDFIGSPVRSAPPRGSAPVRTRFC